ncbi:MAG: Multidrug transporter MdtA [Planctomycetota bacterium]|jgi:RND family efflux transporter MFP subunit
MKTLRLVLQILLPLLVLAGAAYLASRILAARAKPTVVTPTFEGPPVRIAKVRPADLRIDVAAQGTVEAYRSVAIAPQVGGRVIAVGDGMRAGAFVAAGEVLIAVEREDFELAIVQREADVARATLRLHQERAEAEAALRAWRDLEGDRPADPLVRREPQIQDAERSLAAAQAQLRRAKLDLDRTVVVAPFAARVRNAAAEVGQFVQPGQRIAELFDIAAVEVRLPIATADAAFLDLPMFGGTDDANGPSVEFAADFAGRRHVWSGRVVRTEGEIDRRTRQLTVVARVDAPFEKSPDGARPPLAVGMFVTATIGGRTFRDLAVVPRAAVSPNGEVWTIDGENRLRRRQVGVLRLERDRALIDRGLAAGERVLVSTLDTPTDGMPVQPIEPDDKER